MATVKLKRPTFRHLENELTLYHALRREYDRLREDILLASVPPNETGVRRSDPSDETGRKALELVASRRLDYLRRLLEAIDYVLERVSPDQYRLIELRYWSRRGKTWDAIASEIHVSRRTAIYWRDAIIYAIAKQLGWR